MKGGKAAYWAVLALPPLLALLYVHRFGVNVLFMDEFAMVPLVTRDSLPDLATLFARHNEHRLFFPRIVYYFVAKWTDMNSVAVMYCSCLLVGALYCVLARHICKTVESAAAACLLSLATGLVLFHPVQWENILLGFQLGFYMTHIFALLAIFCFFQAERIAREEPRRSAGIWGCFAGAVLCAVVASFSCIQGLLAWPAVVLAWLLAGGRGKLEKRLIGLFCVFGIIAWILYFHDVAQSGNRQNLLRYLLHPAPFLKFILALFGHPYRWNMYAPPYLQGAVILFLGVVVIFLGYANRKTAGNAFPVGFIIYGALCGLGIAVGRFEYTQAVASVSRYSTFTIALLLGILLAVFAIDRIRVGRGQKLWRIAQALSIVLTFTLLWNMPAYLHYSKELQGFRTMIKYYMQTFSEQKDDKMLLLLHSPQHARQFCSTLKQFRYNAFADPPVSFADFWKAAPSPLRQTKSIPIRKDCLGMISYSDTWETSLLVAGWMIHSLEKRQVPQQVAAIAQKKADTPAVATDYYPADRAERQDLAMYSASKLFLHAGFSLTVPADQSYSIGYFFDGILYQCNNLQFPAH